MTNPVSNDGFLKDFQKFVFQEPNVREVYYQAIPKKKFSVEGKNKPTSDKKKPPWMSPKKEKDDQLA